MKEPLLREVGESFSLFGLFALTVGSFVGLGLLVVRLLG